MSNTQFILLIVASPFLAYAVMKFGTAGYLRAKARNKMKENQETNEIKK